MNQLDSFERKIMGFGGSGGLDVIYSRRKVHELSGTDWKSIWTPYSAYRRPTMGFAIVGFHKANEQ